MPISVDFGKTASDYSKYRAGFPDVFFQRLRRFGIGEPGTRVLDMGTGTGALARPLARHGCAVTALDKSAALIEQAKRLDAEAGVRTEYIVASAENMPVPDASFHAVTAGTCWHWFDRQRAASEAKRVLVPGGALVIAYLEWVSLPDNVVAATEELIGHFNPEWRAYNATSSRMFGMYPQYLNDVAVAGFVDIETFSFDIAIAYTHEAWRGRIRASAGVGASLPPDVVERFDAELAATLCSRFSGDELLIPHRIWTIVCRGPVVSSAVPPMTA